MSLDENNEPERDGVEKWIYGGVGPFIGACLGVAIMVRGHLVFPTRAGRAEFHGFDAAVWGLLILSGVTAIHFHYFWGNTDALAPYADVGKIAAIVVLVASIGYLFWRIFVA
jgi:hypothetical protein